MRRYSAAEIRARRERARGRFERYAREVVLPRLGGDAHTLRLEAPEEGLGSLLFFVEAEGAPPMVLRGEGRLRLRRRATAHALLLRLGTNVPRVLHLDPGVLTLLRYGHGFMVEARLPGESLKKAADPGAAAQLGRVFAPLHAHRARSFGHVGTIRGPWNRLPWKLRRWTRKRLRRLETSGDPAAAETARWVASQPPSLLDQPPRLGLGDVSASNVLVHEGEVAFVDLSGVCWGSAAHEVARLHRKLLFGDDALFAAFWSAYREAAAPDLRDEVEAALPLFERLHDL